MLFGNILAILQLTRSRNNKMNDIFELRTVENLRKSVKGHLVLIMYKVRFTYTTLFMSTTLFTYMVQ